MRNVITGVGNLQRRRLGVYIGTRVYCSVGVHAYNIVLRPNVAVTSSAEFYAAQKKGFNSTVCVKGRWQTKFKCIVFDLLTAVGS